MEPDSLKRALATPLSALRSYWLEIQCCGEPERSPIWYDAARLPGWLLSDLATDHTCSRCGAMPVLVLLRSGRDGMPVKGWQLQVAERFVKRGQRLRSRSSPLAASRWLWLTSLACIAIWAFLYSRPKRPPVV